MPSRRGTRRRTRRPSRSARTPRCRRRIRPSPGNPPAAASSTEPALRAGDLVRFDLGCIFKGYRGDVERMAILGEPDARGQRAYDAVEVGVQAGLDAIRPGVPGGAVFEAAV